MAADAPAIPAAVSTAGARGPVLGFGFRTLRSRILAGFALVILVALLTAGSAVAWVVQKYQRSIAIDRLSEVSVAATFVSRQLEARDARPDEISAIIANQLMPARVGRVRVLILDTQGFVIAEQPDPITPREPAFIGKRLVLPTEQERRGPPGRQVLPITGATVWTDPGEFPGRPYTFITSPSGPVPASPGRGGQPAQQGPPGQQGQQGPGGQSGGRGEPSDRLGARAPAYRVVLAVPDHDLGAAWRELIPGLGLGLLAAVAAAVAASFWLSRSITRPLRQITQAAQAIARGDLRQSIPVQGRDEVARLASSFNAMSEEVERSHRTLREFVANASHELRTPLTSIQGFSQALAEGAVEGTEGAAEAGQIINEEAERMRRLVEDLLYLSRVEAQDVGLSTDRVDVEALVREAARRLGYVAEQRDLRLNLEIGPLPDVLGDADQLDRVFGNLLENAGKYTPEGGAIAVRADSPGGSVRVAVHNTGAVIPADDLPRIFDRFYRVDKSRAREVEGSGLGLAIAREVVERHGGTITAESAPGAGTTFTVTLPAVRETAPAPAPDGPTRPALPRGAVRVA